MELENKIKQLEIKKKIIRGIIIPFELENEDYYKPLRVGLIAITKNK